MDSTKALLVDTYSIVVAAAEAAAGVLEWRARQRDLLAVALAAAAEVELAHRHPNGGEAC